MTTISFYLAFELSNCIDCTHFCYLQSLRNNSFFWYPCHMLPVELWEPSFKSSSLPVDRKYQKGQSRDNDIILLVNSKYKRRFINVIFLQDKHNINTESRNIKVMCMRLKTGIKTRVTVLSI
jgi:hypothetical protein